MSKENTKPVKAKRRASKREKKDWFAAYVFIAPVTIGLAVFYLWPFFQNFWFSFNDVNKFNMATFCGIENYKNMIVDTELYHTLWNTLKYVVITVPVGLFLSILLAALLNSEIKGKSLYRTIYFLPSVTMSVAVALIWKWIYSGEYGILNGIIGFFGGKGQNWLSNPSTAFYCIMIVGVWCSVGYNMIILLAGMQGISKSLYEAAAIDGAGAKDQFFHVTIPMLTPTIFFVMITSIIGGFQVFDTIYMMIGKTSMAFESTQTLVAMFYRNGFEYGKKGYAAAISIFVFLLIMIVTAFQMWGQKKWVNYD